MNAAAPARPFFTSRCQFLFLLAALAGGLAANAAAPPEPARGTILAAMAGAALDG